MGERPQHERIAELQAEIEMLRRERRCTSLPEGCPAGRQERYRRLFEDDLTGDFLASVDGRILACNPAFLRIFGFASIEDALQTNIRDLSPTLRTGTGSSNASKEGKVENEGMARRRREAVTFTSSRTWSGVLMQTANLLRSRVILTTIRSGNERKMPCRRIRRVLADSR